MLLVPKLRQPEPTACLPTCILAVLRFQGFDCSYEQARAWCHTNRFGSDGDLAVQGLREAGLDASLSQCSLEELADTVNAGQPVVIVIDDVGAWYHAVVLCEIGPTHVTVMDPKWGDYQRLPLDELASVWIPDHSEALQIGRTTA